MIQHQGLRHNIKVNINLLVWLMLIPSGTVYGESYTGVLLELSGPIILHLVCRKLTPTMAGIKSREIEREKTKKRNREEQKCTKKESSIRKGSQNRKKQSGTTN